MLINTLHTALENRKVSLNGVGVDNAASIRAFAVGGEIMVCELETKASVLLGLIGIDSCFLGDILTEDWQQGRLSHILGDKRLRAASGAIHEAQNSVLVSIPARVLFFLVLLADKGLFNLNNATPRTEIEAIVVTHSLTNTMGHKPRSFESNSESAMQLVGAHTFLAGAHQVDCLKPDVHCDVAGFKDSANFHSEGLAALIALVRSDAGRLAAHLRYALPLSTLGAGCTMGPDARFHLGVSGLFILEVGAG